MADEVATPQPLAAAQLAEAERQINPPVVEQKPPPPAEVSIKPGTVPEGFNPEPPPVSAAECLRAFEDEHIGKDAVRIDGKIERGSGSPFQKLSDELKRQYAALERLIAAEQKVADARAALAAAESEHAVALIDAAPGK